MIGELVEIVGTGHVFKESAEEVRRVILKEKPEVVAVELDKSRYISLLNREYNNKNSKSIKINRFFNPWTFLISKAQEKLGKQFGMDPGGDMLSAIKAAKKVSADLAFIDQDVRKTMGFISNAPVKEKIMLVKEFMGLFLNETKKSRINENIMDLNDLMKLFEQNYPYLFKKLVVERDRYMARHILDILHNTDHFKKPTIVAVVGMGHKEGIKKYLKAR